jgi:hypothetical protein|tara:strand:- start:148 stop:576 length:429 start_codon:yes stop_codon:yes gene_type:complete
MSNEVIGYAELTMNAQGYALYEVSKDHEAKCISIRKVSDFEDETLPFFGRSLPRYDDALYRERLKKINSQKPKASEEYRWTVNSRRSRRAYVPTGRTFASRPVLHEPATRHRPLAERETGKVMSQAEVKRLLAEALGMDGDE